ncbi:uncharacterized protein LOC112514389 [Cynara cardunculus var. scolymus]|uniref:Uncharacterized protein n=1 Tax=Cynara cardunculus var. scolymus TaxID=59895 RepID=A0A103XYP5_CYNCS|nr:uncharacterized protein LOC112514389 [Cynara cardunculus var. scolymus]KVH99353.1 hypothetical protein Ccrd_022416 [Cynara cardunculus var. scolymus]
MGSLMAGWDSPSKSVKLDRNTSMTKVEIASYWRSKKNEEEVHGVLKSSHTFSKGNQKNETEKMYGRSNSLPITKENPVAEIEEEDEEGNREKLFKNGWWMNSRWAFLNEPPVIASETPSRYASQFHVAKKHIDNSNHHVAANGIKT